MRGHALLVLASRKGPLLLATLNLSNSRGFCLVGSIASFDDGGVERFCDGNFCDGCCSDGAFCDDRFNDGGFCDSCFCDDVFFGGGGGGGDRSLLKKRPSMPTCAGAGASSALGC